MATATKPLLTDNRKYLATMVADYLTALPHEKPDEYTGLPRLLVHWDDCDMDYRRFWFHFRRPGLLNVRELRTPVIRDCAREIKKMKAEALKLLEPSIYQCRWDTYSKPVMRYKQFDGVRYAEGYNTDTWIYVLSFYG